MKNYLGPVQAGGTLGGCHINDVSKGGWYLDESGGSGDSEKSSGLEHPETKVDPDFIGCGV